MNKGDLTHKAYWDEDHQVKTKPDMDHEGQRLMDYAVDRVEESLERKAEIARRNKKNK